MAPVIGGVTEWFMEPVLKTGVGQLTEGSNPSPSASDIIIGSANNTEEYPSG